MIISKIFSKQIFHKIRRKLSKIFYNFDEPDDLVIVHFLMQYDFKFYKSLFYEMKKYPDIFDVKKNIFFTPHWNVYYELKDIGNIKYIPKCGISQINYYGQKAQWIIIHALNFNLEELENIDENIRGKIIWRTWGHDVPIKNNNEEYIKKWTNIIGDFYEICGGNVIDKINLENYVKIKRFCVLPYCFNDVQIKSKNECKKTCVNVLINHSGHRSENIIQNIKRLEHFADKNIVINIILSYGDEMYIKEVEKYVKCNTRLKCNIIKKFMPIQEYIEFLDTMDIAVMDQVKSAALDNIEWLLFLRKKLFLNCNGIIYKSFNSYGVNCGRTIDIDNMSYDDFIEPLDNDEKKIKEIAHHNEKENLMMWSDAINSLLRKNAMIKDEN